MKLSAAILVAYVSKVDAAFVSTTGSHSFQRSSVVVKGYLDDLTADLYKDSAIPDPVADKRENNDMSKDEIDRFGPGNLQDFVEFDEYDGGDGQMGVAGDGEAGLDKSDFDAGELANSKLKQTMNKSKMRSARNAWGSSTGYAEKLVKEKNMDVARAQQLENWQNQQEITAKKRAQKFQTDEFDKIEENAEADWRTLGKFGVERNAEFDMDEEFGAVAESEEIEGTLEFNTRTGSVEIRELSLKNPYMGFSDFRAAFTPETPGCYKLTPTEGALQQKTPTEFVIKFKPESIGTFTGALVIETEDFKKTWKLIGTTG